MSNSEQRRFDGVNAPAVDLAEWGLSFDEEVIGNALKRIYEKEFNPDTEIDPGLFRAYARTFNRASAEGISQAVQAGTKMPESDFLNALRYNNAVFSAFKTHRLQNDVARQLTGSDGKLKPFNKWVKDVQPITDHYNKIWLRTEYDTAVMRASQAADWQQFEREKDVLPNLEWIPSTSHNPGEDHRVFWGTILPVDHPFWKEHKPGDRWNCKCRLHATDKGAKPAPDRAVAKAPQDQPAEGLNNNPGKDGELFNDKHPYFPGSCRTCPLSGQRPPRKNCYDCGRTDNLLGDLAAIPRLEKKFRNGGELYVYSNVDRSKGDFKDIHSIARYFAQETGAKATITPVAHYKSPMYKQIYGAMKGTPYYGKCPDLLIDGKFFEYESYKRPWNKKKVGRMIGAGLKQSPYIIIDNNKGSSDRYINRIVKDRINAGINVEEVWLYEKGKARLLYKKQ